MQLEQRTITIDKPYNHPHRLEAYTKFAHDLEYALNNDESLTLAFMLMLGGDPGAKISAIIPSSGDFAFVFVDEYIREMIVEKGTVMALVTNAKPHPWDSNKILLDIEMAPAEKLRPNRSFLY